jgi:DNA-binding response OmpR family regulator
MTSENTPLSLSRRTVLIIEDDEYISRVYEKWLKKSGAIPVVAHSGMEGLVKLKEKKVDIVLLDLGLPGIDGLEILKMIKADSKISTIPIIIVSNSTINENQGGFKEIKRLGVSDILLKYETSLGELVNVIRKNLVTA